jgi:hypothetical protein
MKNYALLAATALALGGFSAASAQQDQTTEMFPNQQQTEQQQDLRDGTGLQMERQTEERAHQVQQEGKQVDEGTANNIRGTLATLTEAALTRGQFRSVVQRLTDDDQERIGDFAREEFEDLDGRIAQFQQDWQERYDQDFDIDNRELVYSREFVQIFEGHVGEAGLAAGRMNGQQDQMQMDRPQDQMQEDRQQDRLLDGLRGEADRERDEARAEIGRAQDDNQVQIQLERDRDRGQAGVEVDRDRDQARVQVDQDREDDARPARDREGQDQEQDHATVTIPASHGLPEVTVHLLNEGTIMDAWRIDLPDHVDGPKLKENLLIHLTAANEQKQQWPADVNDAYRLVTHHVLLAIMDVHPDEYKDAQPAGHQQDTQLEPLDGRQDQQMEMNQPQEDRP